MAKKHHARVWQLTFKLFGLQTAQYKLVGAQRMEDINSIIA